MKIISSVLFTLFLFEFSFSQVDSISSLDQKYLNWYNKDFKDDKVVGASIDKLYEELLIDKIPEETIIVAVIDGGVDINHVDLQGQIWVNEDEIPGNNLDDDNNGYKDDLYGWNFIGNENGENILYENLEMTRILREKNEESEQYIQAKKLYEEKLEEKQDEKKSISRFVEMLNRAEEIIYEESGIKVNSLDDLKKVKANDKRVKSAKKFLAGKYKAGLTDNLLNKIILQSSEYLDYHLEMDFSPRMIVGDNPYDIDDRNYGNPDVIGPNSDHGTSVAGVIAAVRNNNIGIDGIAENVKIMVLRTTPQGDERDKDVALAIRYAVDNGARVINMSFGKELSPQKKFVDEAIIYAAENNVLLIHSAGNEAQNLDIELSYPTNRLNDGSVAKNWLSVGASSISAKKELIGNFSNYGQEYVDLFAPGVNVISLDSSNTYELVDGTSIAGPIVSGVAALILSYYPEFSAEEMVSLLTESTLKLKKKKKVYLPGMKSKEREKVYLSSLSKSGGFINAYNAALKAEQLSLE